MFKKESELLFSDIRDKLHSFSITKSQLQKELSSDIPSEHRSSEDFVYLLQSRCERDSGFFLYISKLLVEASSLANQINFYTEDSQKDWQIQMIKNAQSRASERTDLWKLWFQKLIRWGLGVVAAVLLYSVLTWLSQITNGAIKLPFFDALTSQISS